MIFSLSFTSSYPRLQRPMISTVRLISDCQPKLHHHSFANVIASRYSSSRTSAHHARPERIAGDGVAWRGFTPCQRSPCDLPFTRRTTNDMSHRPFKPLQLARLERWALETLLHLTAVADSQTSRRCRTLVPVKPWTREAWRAWSFLHSL